MCVTASAGLQAVRPGPAPPRTATARPHSPLLLPSSLTDQGHLFLSGLETETPLPTLVTDESVNNTLQAPPPCIFSAPESSCVIPGMKKEKLKKWAKSWTKNLNPERRRRNRAKTMHLQMMKTSSPALKKRKWMERRVCSQTCPKLPDKLALLCGHILFSFLFFNANYMAAFKKETGAKLSSLCNYFPTTELLGGAFQIQKKWWKMMAR